MKKPKYQTKLALWALGVVISLLILSYIVNLVSNFYSPISSKNKREYTLNKNANINLSIKSDEQAPFSSISVLSYNPNEEKILIINVPDETYIKVPMSFGTWPAKSIYGLGESEKNLSGNYLLQQSLASFLGIPIDGYIEFEGDFLQNLRNPLNYPNLLSKLKTNLSPSELLNLSLGIRSVRFDKIHELFFAQILSESKLPDQTKILVADPVKIDTVSSKLAESEIVSEGLSVAIYNATNHPGLAQIAARIVTNLGGNVIMTSNSSFQEKSAVSSLEESFTKQRLSQIFAPSCLREVECSIVDQDSRASVNIILGEDFYQRY